MTINPKRNHDRDWIVEASAHGWCLEGDWPYSQKQVVIDTLRQLLHAKGITLSEEDIAWGLQVRDKSLVDVHAEILRKEAADWKESRQLKRTARGLETLSQADLDRGYEGYVLKAQEAFDESSSRQKRKLELDSLRRELISEFENYQLKAREYLSLKEVAEFWAREADKEPQDIFSKLMEFACLGGFEEDKPPLLLLSDYVRVDLQWRTPKPHKSMSPQEIEDGPPPSAQISASALKNMRSSIGDKAVLAHVVPYCWARRDTIVKLMTKRGLDRAEMPAAWFPGSAMGLDAEARRVPRRPGRRPKYDRVEAREFLFKLLDERGDFDEPGQIDTWCLQSHAEKAIREHFENIDGGGPKESTARAIVNEIVPEWRKLQLRTDGAAN
jgi:hypothetical protein